MREAWKIATEYRKEAIESMKKVAEMYNATVIAGDQDKLFQMLY